MAKSPQRVTKPARLPPRPVDAHKGDFGRVLVVGGSRGMIGAAALAANAALRGGAGLVTLAVPRTIQLTVAGLCPCATSVPLACDQDGQLAPRALRQLTKAIGSADVIAMGPGMGIGAAGQNFVQAALEQEEKPLVLDADGLNNLCNISDWSSLRRCPIVLTPHAGEFARLTAPGAADIQADREKAAVDAAKRWAGAANTDCELVCVLKGAGTVVTDGERVYVNSTGNAGLATGGSGDVLTGLIAALVGQAMSPFDAACLAVHAHGLAGDLGAAQLGQISLTASDVLDFLAPALKEIHEAGADE